MTVACPQCGGEIQPTWDWCHLCGFDPEGLRPPTTHAPPAYAPPGHGPPGYARPGYGPSGYGPPGYGPPPPSGGATAVKVVVGVAVAFVLLIVMCVAAVTLLGRNPTSNVASSSATTRTTAAPTTTAPLVWAPWSPPDGTFVIDFPGTPKVEPYTNTAPQWSSAQYAGVELDRKPARGYGISWWELAPGYQFDDPPAALSSVIDQVDRDPDLLVTNRQLGDFGGNPSITFTATVTDGTAIDGVAFLAGNRAYQLTVVAPAGDPTEYERFVGSFHLV